MKAVIQITVLVFCFILSFCSPSTGQVQSIFGYSKISALDNSNNLIANPQIEWSTYYGGTGTEGQNSIVTDALGNVYTCGTTYGSDGLAINGFQNNNAALNGGIAAAYLVKFNSEGDRIWGTYYSTGGFTGGISVAVDSDQNVYMTGLTLDNGLAFNGFQNGNNGESDAFLVKFSPSGERLWATYLGGSADEVARSITIDDQDNVIITGRTFSTNFPVLNACQENADQQIGLSGDAFLSKFSSSGDLLWSTYYGDSGGEFAFGVSCDDANNIIMTGSSSSETGIFLDGHQSEYGGQTDAFVAKYNAAGILQWSSYYGGSNEDVGYACATDKLGNVFISGETGSLENIESNGFQSTFAEAFLVKFNANGQRIWGTYYGVGGGGPGSGANIGYACATDFENNIYLSGGTNSNAGIASGGFQNSYSGGSDGYIVCFDQAGERLWGSYLGGSNNDYVLGICLDMASTVYVAGTTQSPEGIFFNGFQDTQENETGFISKIITCPEAQLIDLPDAICASSTLVLNPFPAGGAVELIGEGEISQFSYTAPDVTDTIIVTLQYTTSENALCPSSIKQYDLVVLPNIEASANLSTSMSEICENDSVSIIANVENTGIDPSFNWFLNGELSQNGGLTYNTTALENGDIVELSVLSNNICSTPNPVQSNSIVFTVNPIPDLNLVFTDLQGGTLVTDVGFVNYQWFLDGNPIADANASSYIPLENGEYTVLVTNEFGCENSASISLITVSLTEEIEDNIRIFPNPSNGRFTVDFGAKAPLIYTITNSIGEIVYTKSQPQVIEQIDIANLSSGMYIVTIYHNDKISVEKLMIR